MSEKTERTVGASRSTRDRVDLDADVLVIGGGPAGTWAAWSAASAGARVVLADKGYCGTSGATAPSGVGVWYVAPEPSLRAEARASREELGGFLSERRWMDRVLDCTYENVNRLGEWGYPFPTDAVGQPQRRSLQGPEYMRVMRKRVKSAGVRILDHSPALELLVDDHGVAGAAGVSRQDGFDYRVRAHAVVIATGGCAFLSHALGCNVLTGDGGLLAAEVGAELSGMEFSNAYGIAPAFASVTKAAFYRWATFYYADGREIPGAGSAHGRSIIARTLLEQPVYACLDKAGESLRADLRASQPHFFLPFDRAGIDLLTQHFPVTLRLEGTVRGTGGIRIAADDCSTNVRGLYAAGDAATRELICGGFTGGGSHNAAWAISSGTWAGHAAAGHAKSMGASAEARSPRGAGRAALPPSEAQRALDHESVIRGVQNEVFPYDKNLFRTTRGLTSSLDRLEELWREAQAPASGGIRERIRGREAAALVATGALDVCERARTAGDTRHAQAHGPSSSRSGAAAAASLRRPGSSLGASRARHGRNERRPCGPGCGGVKRSSHDRSGEQGALHQVRHLCAGMPHQRLRCGGGCGAADRTSR